VGHGLGRLIDNAEWYDTSPTSTTNLESNTATASLLLLSSDAVTVDLNRTRFDPVDVVWRPVPVEILRSYLELICRLRTADDSVKLSLGTQWLMEFIVHAICGRQHLVKCDPEAEEQVSYHILTAA
jgi:hypothetical protein